MNPSDLTAKYEKRHFNFSYEDEDDEGLGDEEALTELLEQHDFWKCYGSFNYEYEGGHHSERKANGFKVLKELGFNVEE